MRPRIALGLCALLFAALSVPASATPRAVPFGGRRAPLVATTPISVSVVAIAGGATLQSTPDAAIAELGTVSANPSATAAGVSVVRRARSYVVVSSIGLRADSALLGGTVALQAFLDGMLPGVIVRLDGVVLATVPRTFDAAVPLGIVTRHRLEIEIPDGLPASQVPSEIPLELGAVPN